MQIQGYLNIFKKEILRESQNLTPLLINSIEHDIWPMLKFNKEIRNLVRKRQKYLSLLSNQYGFHSEAVTQQIDEWLTKLDLRVFAIETVYRSAGHLTSGIDNRTLKRENLFDYLETLKYNNLKHYNSDPIRRVYIPKGKTDKRPLGILTIRDRIVQTLFVQIIEPIIDIHADNFSFGFRNGRNPHQAIGQLSKLLQIKPTHLRVKTSNDKRYFAHSKYILNIDIEKFFDKVNHDWLLMNYPFPYKFINILKSWLSAEINYQGEYEILITGFPQGSVIGPSLANYTLNGLENLIVPEKKTAFDVEKFNYYTKKGFRYNKSSSIVRKTLTSSIVRYADNFIVVVNDKKLAEDISNKIDQFLKIRGLNKNHSKSEIIKWGHNAKFDYLGFTFHYILAKKKFTKITTQRKSNINVIRTGLYVYPSKIKVLDFKKKIKTTITNNLNLSPYRLINILNPIIRRWGNYFAVGTLRAYSRLDHYIWYRIWRYLRRKYKKVSTNILVARFFQGVETPSGRKWQFHGTHNDTMKRKGSVVWLLLLTQLNNPVPAQMFAPKKDLVTSTFYIDESIFNEYNLNIIKLRSVENSVNKWSLLYKKQNGLCDICGYSLGYLIAENLEIHHVEKVSNLNIGDSRLGDINNLRLVHKICHKTTLSIKE